MKIFTVVGARPQFIKARPVSAALRAAGCTEFLLHTGQHYDDAMSQRFFTELGLRDPDVNLNVGPGPQGEQTGRMLAGIEQHLLQQKPDWVIVYGDTNSTLAGALAAAKLAVPIAHIEAGLRSFNRRMPEEINRVLTDHLAQRLFCPSQPAVENLAREGITSGVAVVGDVMLDALRHFEPIARARSQVLARLGLAPRSYYLATVHRAENTAEATRLAALLKTLSELDRPVVLPLHPRTRTVLERAGLSLPSAGLKVIEPLGYLDMLRLTAEAEAVLTDSGGLQKEAYWLGTRCLTLRTETEWTETLADGWNQLTGVSEDRIRIALAVRPSGPQSAHYGTGDAANIIATTLAEGRAS